jgi:mutator protein MutT
MGAEKNFVRVGAAALVEDERGRILIGKRNVWPKGMWIFPGGGVNFGEKADDAVVREIKEETGLEIKKPELFTVYEMIVPKNDVHRVIFYFKAKVSSKLKLRPSTDIEELKWLKTEEIMKLDKLGDATIPILKIAGYL